MKKINIKLKKKTIYLLILILFLLVKYWYEYINTLRNYYIEEKIVVQFDDPYEKYLKEDKYIIDLNNWTYERFNWKYKKYCTDLDGGLVYNKDQNYYFKITEDSVYDKNGKLKYNDKIDYIHWTKNWRYFISVVWRNTLFWKIFFSDMYDMTIVVWNPENWNSIDIPIYANNDNWNFLNIHKILWYVDKELEENPDMDLEWKRFCTFGEVRYEDDYDTYTDWKKKYWYYSGEAHIEDLESKEEN